MGSFWLKEVSGQDMEVGQRRSNLCDNVKSILTERPGKLSEKIGWGLRTKLEGFRGDGWQDTTLF